MDITDMMDITDAGGCVVIKVYGAASLFIGLGFGYLSCD